MSTRPVATRVEKRCPGSTPLSPPGSLLLFFQLTSIPSSALPVLALSPVILGTPRPHYWRTMNDPPPEAGPSRLAFNPSPSLSPPPPDRRKRHVSEIDEDYSPFPSPIPTRLFGGGKPRTRPRKTNATTTPRHSDPHPSRKRVTRARARRNSSPSITASLESIASEDTSVKREIHRLNLGLRDVQGDGNCLFRALADQLWGVQKRHVEVRKLVCDHLEMFKETMRKFVQPFLPDGETYDEYVHRMRQLSELYVV